MSPTTQLPLNPVRSSARKSFNNCEWAWDLAYNKNVQPHETKSALRFGTLIHSALEKFYRSGTKRGPHPAKTFQRLYRADAAKHAEFGVYSDEVWVNAYDLGTHMMRNYIDLYGKDERYKVIATEQPFQQPVYETHWKLTNERGKKVKRRVHRFTYMGVLDGIWWDTEKERMLLVDHKTAATIKQLVAKLPWDLQSTAYWTWGVDWMVEQGMLKSHEQLDGLLFNIMAKSKGDDDRPRNAEGLALNKPTKPALIAAWEDHGMELPGRASVKTLMDGLTEKGVDPWQYGEVSKRQGSELFMRFPSFRGESERELAREMAMADFLEMEEIRSGQRKPRKMYPDGPFGCTACAYKDVCELHEVGEDWQELLEATMSGWDPYSEHEMAEAR